MVLLLLSTILLDGSSILPAIAQETNETTTITERVGSQLDSNTGDEQDLQRVRKLTENLPPFVRHALLINSSSRRAPVMVFRRWAAERKRFVPTFLFCTFAGLIGTAFFSRYVAVAQECCRQQFWRCIGRSILTGVTILISVRVLDNLVITQPLSAVLIAMLEAGLIAGLSIGVSLIGERLSTKSGLCKIEYFGNHQRVTEFVRILLGSLVIALIVQIPGIGLMPRIGIRVAVLIAILGSGGLLATKFGTRPITER
ncbi:MAG: hypothetical protein K2X93_02070 [Candidatus Obscuribacterales bacterium]|nr:hypothetical protein [Candidatus Obscuribacterales bacterium]